MAADANFYRDTAATDPLSDGDWTDPLDVGTVNIPPSGTAYSTGGQVTLKNDGTTSLNGCSISAVAGAGQTDTVYDERVSFAPDSAGSPGAWGADGDPFDGGDLAPAATVTFWIRVRADAGDTQPANPVNFSLQVDATSV